MTPFASLFLASLLLGCSAPEQADSDYHGLQSEEDALTAEGGYGTNPGDEFNVPGQKHHDVCVTLKGTAKLRYPDGTWTGYELANELLQYDDDPNEYHCNKFQARLDAKGKPLQSSEGPLVFHRGGGGYQPQGVGYGHLLLSDIDQTVAFQASKNGKACAASKNPSTEGHFRVRVEHIPPEMSYCKPGTGCSNGGETVSYTAYGDPAFDKIPEAARKTKDGEAVHYTSLVWSWVNVQKGGVVRALLKDDDVFHRCDVPDIKLLSVTQDGKPNGWVKAVYGKTRPGKSWVYGWLVHSHKYYGDDVGVVSHLVDLSSAELAHAVEVQGDPTAPDPEPEPQPESDPIDSACSQQKIDDCATFGCSCADEQCSSGFCDGTGCTAKRTGECAAYGCGCVDGECSGGYCDGTGCTAKRTSECATVGCNCVDMQCDGAFCGGTGCTAKRTNDCAAFGCGCVSMECKGGACPG